MDHRTRRALQPNGLPPRATESHCRHASWAAGPWCSGWSSVTSTGTLPAAAAAAARACTASIAFRALTILLYSRQGRMHTIGFDPHLRDRDRPATRSVIALFCRRALAIADCRSGPSAAGTRSPGLSAAPDAPAPSCGNASAAQAITADNRSTPLTIQDAFPSDHSGRGPDDHRMPSDADRFPPTVDPNNVFTRAVRRRTDVSTRQCQPTVESHEERSPPSSLHQRPAGTTPISRQPV